MATSIIHIGEAGLGEKGKEVEEAEELVGEKILPKKKGSFWAPFFVFGYKRRTGGKRGERDLN